MRAGDVPKAADVLSVLGRAGTSAQPFGPRPAGAPGRKLNTLAAVVTVFSLGGLRRRGLVLPEPGMGLCSQLPGERSCLCPRGRVGVTGKMVGRGGGKMVGRLREGLGPSRGDLGGGSRGDDVILGAERS